MKLRAVLPATWVFRDKSSDYGIDGEVEVFDADGNATGQIFLVQLKGSSSADRRIKLKVDTLNYFKSLKLPVLLALWEEPHNRIYVKWASEVGRQRPPSQQKTISIVFGEASLWSTQTPDFLRGDLDDFRFFDGAGFSLPIRLCVDIPSIAHIGGVAGHALKSEMRKLAQDYPSLISITSERRKAVVLGLDGENCFISIPNKLGIVIHGIPPEVRAEALARDLTALVAVPLGRLGRHDFAAKFILEFGQAASVALQEEIAVPFVESLLRSNEFTAAFQFAGRALERDRSGRIEVAVLTIALSIKNSAQDRLRAELVVFLRSRLELAEKSGNTIDASACHFNLGNLYRNIGPYRLALRHFRKAVNLNERYARDSSLTWRVASALFSARRYRAAAACYGRALELGSNIQITPLYADALMFAGRYREALDVFEKYFKVERHIESEWLLKAIVLRSIVHTLKIDVQDRNSKEAMNRSTVMEGDSGENVRERMLSAMGFDALCGLAWFNHGVALKDKKTAEAGYAFLVCALLQPRDIEAWRNTILIWVGNSELDAGILPRIIDCAYFYNGEQVIFALRASIQDSADENFQNRLMEVIDLVVSNIPQRREAIDIRLIGRDGEFHEVQSVIRNRN